MVKTNNKKFYKKRAPYKKRANKRSTKTNFAKKVLNVIQRKAEHKVVVLSTSQFMPNYLVGSPLQICLTPTATTCTISQSDLQGGRIGNKVRTVKCVIRGIMYPTGYNATYNPTPSPQDIRMVVSRNKISPTLAPSLLGFYQNGNSSQSLSGTLADVILPVNRNLQTVYLENKIFKLGHSAYTGTGSQAGVQFNNSNDYKMSCKFVMDVTKYIPKIIEWNDANDAPTSASTWMTLIASEALNIGPGGTQKCAIYYTVEYTYTDF